VKITRRRLRQMILEQFRSREEAAAHSLRTGHAMIWEPGMEDEPPVVPPREQPGYSATKTLMTNRIQGVVTKLSGFSGGPSNDVIRVAVMDALDEVVPAGGGARLSEQSERMDDPFPMSINEGKWEASRWQELSGLLTEDVD